MFHSFDRESTTPIWEPNIDVSRCIFPATSLRSSSLVLRLEKGVVGGRAFSENDSEGILPSTSSMWESRSKSKVTHGGELTVRKHSLSRRGGLKMISDNTREEDETGYSVAGHFCDTIGYFHTFFDVPDEPKTAFPLDNTLRPIVTIRICKLLARVYSSMHPMTEILLRFE